MLLRTALFFAILSFMGQFLFSQTDGKLAGKVLDQNGDPLPSATVIVYEGNLVKHGSITDDKGVFSIQPVAPGMYRVEARFLGKSKSLDGVSVLSGQTRDIVITFVEDVTTTLGTVDIFAEKVFEKDPAVVTTLSQADIKNIPRQNVQSLAALTAGVFQSDQGATDISIRGARSSSTTYIVDGVKVRGQTPVPQAAIQQLQVYTGGTPAEFGDFTGGVISYTTMNPASQFSGALEYLGSDYLDPFNRRLASATVSGPLITRKRTLEGTDTEYKTSVLGFFFSGEYDYNYDQSPVALGIYQLKPGLLEDLQQTPVVISPDGQSFRSRAFFVRADDWEPIQAKKNNESLRLRGLLRLDFQPADNILIKAGGNYEYINTDNWSIANMLFAPDPQNQFIGGNYRGWLRFQQSFKSSKDSPIRNLFYSIQGDYSLYQRRFQNSVHQDRLFDYGYVGKFDFEQFPVYQYVNDPFDPISSSGYYQTLGYGFRNMTFDDSETRNQLYANYNNVIFDYAAANGGPSLNNIFELAFRQGILNGSGPGGIYSIYSGIGSNTGGYQKYDFAQYRLLGQATAEVKGHNLKLGFEFEQRDERYYLVGARGLWGWMRQYANFHLNSLNEDPASWEFVTRNGEWQDTINVPRLYQASEQKQFSRNLREKLGLPIDGTEYVNIDALSPEFFTLDMFNADELLADGIGPIGYSGYNYLGERVPRGDPYRFFTDLENRPQNPFAPTYISAFIQDKFEFEDIIFNVGLRVDRFDANQPVLKDNFSLVPTYTAAEVAAGNLGVPGYTLPASIGSDFVPYVNSRENFSEVIGYRSGESWFDLNGSPVSSAEIARRSNGRPIPAIREDDVSPSSFRDYEPQTVFMPRISFSFPISDQALFFAHYDVLSQRPGQLLATQSSLLANQISDYVFLENRPTSDLLNPNLRPEITIDYEAGFKQALGTTMALSVSAYYRELRNMVNFRRFTNAYPFSYDSYDNLDFGTVKGFSFSYDMRRTGNVQLRASYTLQFSDATGSNFSSARNVVNFLEGVGVLRVPLPVDTDQRHRIVGVVDYRFTDKRKGPSFELGDKVIYPLADFGSNLTITLGSGTPYTQSAIPVQSVAGGINIVNQVKGSVNGVRRPWQFRADLRLDKSFDIAKKKGKNGNGDYYSLAVFLAVYNLFDNRNVIGVYQFTGLPDDDGWLTSDSGRQLTITQIDPVAYVDQYSARVANPDNYSLPRRTQLGVIFNF